MGNISISLDMDRVQSSVSAAIRPTVEALLAKEDIGKIIAKALKNPIADDPYSMAGLIYGRRSGGTLLDTLVQSAIKEMASQYVQQEMRAQKERIEAAFCKMMQGSSNKLVASFAAAITKAVAEDFEFDLKVSVEHSAAASSDDD